MNTKEFLQMVAGEGGVVHVRTIPANDEKNVEEFWIDPSLYSAETIEEQFNSKSLNEEVNMFFQVSSVDVGSKKPKVANAIWVDLDIYKYPGGELQAMGLLRALPKPTVIVRSGRGMHIYWKLKEPVDASGPMSPAQTLSKSMHWFLGGDPGHSPARLLRIPNTYNFKPKEYEGGKLCEIIQHNDVEYTEKDFPVDEILMRIGHKLMTKIMLGPTEPGTDRSEYDYNLAAALFEGGFSEEEVKYLLLTYPFSGKVGSEPSNALNYVGRTVKNALFRVQIKGINPQKPPKDPVAWVGKSLTDILKEEKPPFVVSDFLPAAGVAMLAAPPKARKSWAVMQLAYAVGTGTDWIGFKVPEPKKVLYVQAELPNWMVAERIVQMYGSEQLNNVTFYHIPAANLLEDEDMQGLLDAVVEQGAELVIIDPIANFWQGDENSSSSVNHLFDQIAKIQALDCAVVLVHHSRKTDQNERLSPQHQRGSNVFFARPAAVMTLSPMIIPGQVPHTWADFALRAAAPKDGLKLYTDSTGKFTVEPPTLEHSGPPSKLLEIIQSRTGGQDKSVIMFGDDL